MTANPKPSAEAARRAAIKHRRETSTFWMAVHLLGSLNVAVILLATIAAMIAFATIMESRFDTAVARYYIYDNPLFTLWLVVLALNLLCAAFTRWPWQRKHLGFVVTHAGIILMLTGALVGRAWGFEAFVTLDKTKPPEHQLVTKDDVLTIGTSDGLRGEKPFDIEMRPPTEARPFTMPLENSPLKLVVDRSTDKLVPDDSLRASEDSDAPPGIALHFVNAGMNQNVPADLMLDDNDAVFDFFGMAKVTMVNSLDEAHPIVPPKPVEPAAAPSSPRDDTPFHETQVVFANSPQSTVVDTDSDARSGYVVTLDPVPNKPGDFEATVSGPSGATKSLPVKDAGQGWTNLLGDGDPIMFRVGKYWPDFAMKNGVPVSLSDKPNHPVALVQITGPSKLLPPAAPKPAAPAAAAPPMPKGLAMRIALAKEPGRIVYEMEREGKIEARGTAAVGEMIHLGWSKWEAKVDAVLPHAEVHRDMKEFAGDVTPMMASSLRPGLRAHLVAPDGTSGPAEWIPSGTARELFAGRDFAWIGFGQRVIPLNFTITLEDFQVPRDEGTDTPSNYISSVRFDDPATGQTVRGTASMNEPAMFPGDFWRSLLGWNYKFSQANWNPDNLNETTLQVLYDPGWPFKWTGSLGICIGIALMFYFMPKRSAAERGGREDEPDEMPAKESKE